MKQFLLKTALFGLIVTLITTAILTFFGGYVDYFYPKFAAPAQASLILGDSRSFQGIQPHVIGIELKSYPEPLNFSFTFKQIAYGALYTRSVMRKLDADSKNGLFILSVHPWLLAEREEDNIAENKFFEAGMPPHNMHFASMNPNVEYFFRNQEYFHFKALVKRNSIVHDNGWLEEFNLTSDSATLNKWKRTQDSVYQKLAVRWKPSVYREQKLSELVQLLESRGTVVLLRMPVGAEILASEQKFWPQFDRNMEKIARAQGATYINFAGRTEGLRLYDGLHLDKESGARFTRALCDSIRKISP